MYERKLGYNQAVEVMKKWIKTYEDASNYSNDKELQKKVVYWKELLQIVEIES